MSEEKELEIKVNASDSAIKLARKKNVDLTQIDGSGKDGMITKKDVETYSAGNVSGEKPEGEKKVSSLSDLDTSLMVNSAKTLRAFNALMGKTKPDTSETALAARFRGEKKGQELFEAIYVGLGGLMNVARASKNRDNEKKAAKKRNSLS